MTYTRKLTFYHAPQTRSFGTLVLLEELNAPHELHVLNVRGGDTRKPEYLAVNPMGKVPALKHGDALITEQVAIFTYLADFFPANKLAPALTDPLRGPYLRWMAYCAACFEPAVIDKFMKREPAPTSTSPDGGCDTVINLLIGQLSKGPYTLGETFTAADVLWGTSLAWKTSFKLVHEDPAIMAYVKRIGERPATVKTHQKDAELIAKLTPAS